MTVGALAEHAPQDEELKRIAACFERIAAKYPNASAELSQRGRYYAMTFDVMLDPDEEEDDTNSSELEKFEEECKSLAHWVYRQLLDEYEYQLSDECIVESLIANEYEFTEDGTRA